MRDPFNYISNPRNIEWVESVESIVSMGSKVFILDATGDVIFRQSELWSIIKEYPSVAKIKEVNYIDMNLSRNKSKLSKASQENR